MEYEKIIIGVIILVSVMFITYQIITWIRFNKLYKKRSSLIKKISNEDELLRYLQNWNFKEENKVVNNIFCPINKYVEEFKEKVFLKRKV